MIRYSEFRPTQFDPHFTLEDREDWFVAPWSQTRDSGPYDQSNFHSCLKALGGESETVEVHRFGHWGPGWFEIIIVHPDHVKTLEELEAAFSNYPVVDDEDLSRREYENAMEYLEQCISVPDNAPENWIELYMEDNDYYDTDSSGSVTFSPDPEEWLQERYPDEE